MIEGVKAKKMIEGVKVKRLRQIPDERGRLIECLRNDDKEFFIKFGQVYVTVASPGAVKGWHYHKKQTDNFVAISGMAKVVLYDTRKKSKTHGEIMEVFMGEQNPLILQIPPYVMHGLKGISEKEAIIVNIPTEVYHYESPDEFRVDAHDNDIPYDWSRRDG